MAASLQLLMYDINIEGVRRRKHQRAFVLQTEIHFNLAFVARHFHSTAGHAYLIQCSSLL